MPSRAGARTHVDVAAFHEAGHALAAVWEGRQLGRVRVRRDRPGTGVTYHARAANRNPYDPALSPGSARAAWEHTLARFLTDVRIKLAGPVAEAKALNQPLRALGAYSDLAGCKRLVSRLDTCWRVVSPFTQLPPLDSVALVNQQRAYVRRWVAQPRVWCLVHRVASALSREGSLSGAEVYTEIGRVQRPHAQLPLGLDRAELLPNWQELRSHQHGPGAAAARAPSHCRRSPIPPPCRLASVMPRVGHLDLASCGRCSTQRG